jgi:PAS domain S-box-containing protein
MRQPLSSDPQSHYAVFDHMLEGVQVVDFEFKYLYLNQVVVAQAKSTLEELLHQKMTDKFPGIDQSPMFQLIKTCMEERTPQTLLNEFDHLDGTKGYFELRMQPVPEGVLILSIDETERMSALNQLVETNMRYRCVADASFDAIWDWDLITDTATFGESYKSIFGHPDEKVNQFSSKWLDLVHPEDQANLAYQIQCVTEASEKKWLLEYRFLKANGDYAYVLDRGMAIKNERGKTIRIIGAKQDITKQKRSEQQKAVLAAISPIFSQYPQLKGALDAVLGKLIIFLEDYKLAELWLTDTQASTIKLISKETLLPNSEEYYTKTSHQSSFKLGEGMPGEVWQRKESIVWQNVSTHPSFLRREFADLIGLKTVFGLPLIFQDTVVGVLVLGSSKQMEYEDSFSTFYSGLTDLLGSEIQRKQIEQELGEIFNAAPDIICLAGFDGYFKKVNPKMGELLGYTEEELLSHPSTYFTHPDDLKVTTKETVDLTNNKSSQNFENRYITKDGRIIWLSWTIKLDTDSGLIYCVAKDITDKKELEELLKVANQLARNGGWEVNVLENNKVYYSKTTREILELDEHVIPSLESDIIFFKEGPNRNRIIEAVRNAILTGTPYDLELEIVTAKGNHKWVRAIGKAEFRNGVCARLVGSFQDVTVQKNQEIELTKLNEILEERALKLQQSNEELEQFAYVASHDLQEPLRMVTSFLSLLERKYDGQLDDKAKQYIHFAVDGSKRMRQIILDLLEFSRVGRIREELDNVNLNVIVESIVALNKDRIEENKATIRYVDLPTIKSYETPVYQVLQNLISNSLKYHSTAESPKIEITVEEREREWLFNVKDNGIGIDPSYHAKVFQLFQRLHTKTEYSGSGIGLSLCKKIIEDLKGKIWIESEEGKGCTFIFTLPKNDK